MKKLIAIILIMALVVPAAALSDTMAGCWCVWVPQSVLFGYGNIALVLVLNEDNTFILTNVQSTKGEITDNILKGTWTYSAGKLLLSTNKNSTVAFEYRDDMLCTRIGDTIVGLKKTPDYEIKQLQFINE